MSRLLIHNSSHPLSPYRSKGENPPTETEAQEESTTNLGPTLQEFQARICNFARANWLYGRTIR